jgi:bacterioferritin
MANIIDELQRHLPKEISANVRYAGHANLIRFHGYLKLADRYEEEAKEERCHADQIMWRLQELGEMPEYIPPLESEPLADWDIKDIFTTDLEVEHGVLDSLTECIDAAEGESDYASGELLRKLVTDTQGHITWLKTQLAQLEELGLMNYLQAQL